MRPKDPYAHQRAKKSENQQRILRQIETAPSSFGEIETKVELSPPVLTNHLKELEKKGVIARQVEGRRVKDAYQQRKKSGTNTPRNRREVVRCNRKTGEDHSSAKSLLDLAEFAKTDPRFFDEFMQWMKDYMTLVTSEDTLRWLNRHGDSGGRLLQAEVMKKLKSLQAKQSESGGDLKELILVYQNLLNAMREVVSEKEGNQ